MKEAVDSEKIPSICYVTTLPVTLKAFVLPSAEYLADHGGFQVTLVSSDCAGIVPPSAGSVRGVTVPMSRGVSLDGVRAIWQLFRLFRRERFEIVQYSTPNAAFYASIASTLARVPVRVYAQWGIRYVGFKGVKRAVFKALERLTCLLSTHVEPDSFGNLTFAVEEKLYPQCKGHVIWHGSAAGVDLIQFDHQRVPASRTATRRELGVRPDDFVLGFVGRLSRDKGARELLTATRRLLDEYPNAYLLLVGPVEGDEPEDGDWARNHDRIVRVGPTDRVPDYMAAMDVFVLPSYREGFGMVVVEAEAMGIPVIVTDIPGPLDAVLPEETGIVVPVRDAQALHRAVCMLLADPQRRAIMGRAAVEFVRANFDREVFGVHLLDRRRTQLAQSRESRADKRTTAGPARDGKRGR